MLTEQFLRHGRSQKNFSPHTLEAYEHDLKELEGWLAVQMPPASLEDPDAVAQITHKQLRNWLASLMKQGLSPRSVSRKLASAKSFFRYLHHQQILAANPAEKVRTPAFSKKLPAFVPVREMNTLLENIPFPDDFEGKRDRCLLELLYGCGLRRAEVIDLRVEEIDFFQQQVKVRGKGNKERLVPFGKAVRAAMESYADARNQLPVREKSSFFLLKNGKSVYPALVQRVVKRYLSLIDAPQQKSPHVLRHSYATHLLDSGADLPSIKELLGHSSLAATQVYTHHTLSKLKRIHNQAHPRAEEPSGNQPSPFPSDI